MKQGAIILNGNDVVKITNLKRKYNKIITNPNIKILEECDLDRIDEKYDYWKRIIAVEDNSNNEETLKYTYKNLKTGYTIVSIYPTLENCKFYIKDWEDYERV